MPIRSLLASATLLCAFSCASQTLTVTEDFSSNPGSRGWSAFGDPSLFQWDSTNQNLLVTWDSSHPNGGFYHPLPCTAGRGDSFSVGFDLWLDDIGFGPEGKPYAQALSIGFLNVQDVTRTNFLRGTGVDCPNLVEFSYFFDYSTIWPVAVSTNSQFNYNSMADYTVAALEPGHWFHVEMVYSNETLVTTMTQDGSPFGPIQSVKLAPSFTDFRVNALSVTSYTSVGDPWNSLLAHGRVDNLAFTTLLPLGNITGAFADGVWRTRCDSRVGWRYLLERSPEMDAGWATVGTGVEGNGSSIVLEDTTPAADKAFYRVRAERL